jgi:hypothetical protein
MLVRRVSRHVLLVPTSHSPRISRVRQPSGWSEALDHYAFRLFLRRAIQKSSGFVPEEVTQYVKPAKATALAESLVGLGLAAKVSAGRYRLLQPSRSFGGTLEWYVARELRRRFGFDVGGGLKFQARGVGSSFGQT